MASDPETRADDVKARWIYVAAFTVAMALLIAAGCDSVNESGGDGSEVIDDDLTDDASWLIPRSEVFDGGPGKDGIPSIDAPRFAAAAATDYVQDDRLVVGVRVGDVVRAYPHQVLDWHEIVNDEIGGKAVAVTYCPLTGTGIAWDRTIDGEATEFGVSGLLFRNNIIPYDRRTDSEWSQMQLRGVHGPRKGFPVETVQVVETTWSTWRAMYPESEVLTTKTGFPRNYQGFAYGRSYLTDPSQILFPVQNEDDRLSNKQRVHGIMPKVPADQATTPRVYVITRFGSGVHLVEDGVGGRDYLVVGSSNHDFAVAFERALPDGTRLSFEPVQDALPVILQDEAGNRWDLFGVAVEGPRAGERLTPAPSYTGYWFGWADFFPGVEIYGE